MSVFKSPKRKIFRKKKDVDVLIDAAKDLNAIVEGDRIVMWTNVSGVRFLNTPEWCAFRIALQKVLPCLLLAFLLGFSMTAFGQLPPIPKNPVVKSFPTNRNVTLAWDTVPLVPFYQVHYGTNSRAYRWTNSLVASNSCTISNLSILKRWYFAVVAVAANGLKSDYSAEVTWPKHLEPRTNVIIITMWSTNGIDWIDLKRETNAVPGFMGLWKLRVE